MIAQTNINQEFSLAEHFPTKHWGDLFPLRIVFKGPSKLACKIASTYHKVIFLNMATLFDQVAIVRNHPQVNTNTSSLGYCNHPASQKTIRPHPNTEISQLSRLF